MFKEKQSNMSTRYVCKILKIAYAVLWNTKMNLVDRATWCLSQTPIRYWRLIGLPTGPWRAAFHFAELVFLTSAGVWWMELSTNHAAPMNVPRLIIDWALWLKPVSAVAKRVINVWYGWFMIHSLFKTLPSPMISWRFFALFSLISVFGPWDYT
jgi:hypothetical protein